MDKRYRIVSAIIFAVILAVLGLQQEIMAYVPAQYATLSAIIFMIVREAIKEYGQQAQDAEV